jgi:predicted permease
LTVETCQHISLLIINFLIPGLIFNNVVSSLYDGEIKIIGIIALTAFLYEGIGLFFGLIVRYTTPNPKAWFGGVMAAAAFNNCSDIPIAYVTTLAAGTLFPAGSGQQGTAYAVIFLVVFCLSLFNLGGFQLIARDFQTYVDDPERFQPSTPIVSVGGIKKGWNLLRKKQQKSWGDKNSMNQKKDVQIIERSVPIKSMAFTDRQRSNSISVAPNAAFTQQRRKQITGLQPVRSGPPRSEMDDVIISFSMTDTDHCLTRPMSAPADYVDCTSSSSSSTNLDSNTELTRRPWYKSKIFVLLWYFIKDLRRPQSLALIVSMTVTMVPPLRRLFYIEPTAPQDQYGIPEAPDGLPVLDFVIDFTSFIGNACVPLGLSMLGATIARLEVKQLPKGFWKSILLMSVLKLVVLPIIALAWVIKLQQIGWLSRKDDMAVFVMIVTSAVPTATSQLYITAMYTPPGDEHVEMDCLAAYLICQYSMLLFSMTVLVTYTLKNVVQI